MKNKKLLALLFVGLLFLTCTEDSLPWKANEQQQGQESTMMKLAQMHLLQNGNVLSLPTPHASKASTKMAFTPSDAIPLWEEAKHVNHKDENILLIPLQSKQEIHSRVRISQENELSYQFSKTFSRLVVRCRENTSFAQIITYLPESHYASEHKEKLNTLKFDPREINFHGILLVSTLKGELLHGLLYENGIITCKITPKDAHAHSDECTHEHPSECIHQHLTPPEFLINLYTSSNAQTRSYGDDEENGNLYCSFCGLNVNDCNCWTCEGEYIYCDNCGLLQAYCICGSEGGGGDGGSELCPICGENPCICNEGTGGDSEGSGSGSGEGRDDESSIEESEDDKLKVALAEIKDILAAKGCDINKYIIRMTSEICCSNARISIDGAIEVCQCFFDYDVNDRASIIWHEAYHIDNNHIREHQRITLAVPLELNPEGEVLMFWEEYVRWKSGLPDSYTDLSLYKQEDFNILDVYEKEYYENEINTYRAERDNTIDKSSHYYAEICWFIWLYTEIYNYLSE